MGRVAQTPLAAVGLLTPAPGSTATTALRRDSTSCQRCWSEPTEVGGRSCGLRSVGRLVQLAHRGVDILRGSLDWLHVQPALDYQPVVDAEDRRPAHLEHGTVRVVTVPMPLGPLVFT